jgi:2-amino-4-hydroxy-6-hydroxymethyldihydropteridine diphosphokinase
MRFHIGMGSNEGDREGELRAAAAWLGGLEPGARFSGVYATGPVDCPPGSAEFYNAVAEIEFRDGAAWLLEKCLAYEASRGRKRGIPNASRPIDLDLLLAGELEMNTSKLRLPHPRLAERLFVLEPLAELAEGVGVPPGGRTVRELLEACRRRHPEQRCQKIGSL